MVVWFAVSFSRGLFAADDLNKTEHIKVLIYPGPTRKLKPYIVRSLNSDTENELNVA